MSGHRKAALALYALASEDRELILADLPESDRRVLRGYLGELEELGFGAIAVNDVLGEEAPAMPATPAQAVAAAAAGDVLRAVAGEPLAVVSALLNAQAWPWEAAFLAALPAHARLRVEALRTAGRQAPARDAFVVGAVARALGERRGAHPDAAAPARFAGILKRLRAWTR